jgi:hypothetical protein
VPTTTSSTTGPDALTYDPLDEPAVTEPARTHDTRDLQSALARARSGRGHTVLGISDSIVAILLAIVALFLVATGRLRRYLDRFAR